MSIVLFKGGKAVNQNSFKSIEIESNIYTSKLSDTEQPETRYKVVLYYDDKSCDLFINASSYNSCLIRFWAYTYLFAKKSDDEVLEFTGKDFDWLNDLSKDFNDEYIKISEDRTLVSQLRETYQQKVKEYVLGK